MAPILYKIPLTIPFYGPVALPIYGFGIMLVMAFIFAPWLAWWRARARGSTATWSWIWASGSSSPA